MNVPTMSGVGASFTPPAKELYLVSNQDGSRNVFGANWMAMIFKANTGFTLTGLKLPLFRTGTPGTVTISIQALSGGDPDGTDLSVTTIDGDALGTIDVTQANLIEVSMPAVVLGTGVSFAIVIRNTAGAGNTINWNTDDSSPTYTDGNREDSANSGNTWTAQTGTDMCFEAYGV